MSKKTQKHDQRIVAKIFEADTPEKVWALVASLADDGNNYSAITYLNNLKDWTAIAQDLHA